MRAGMGPLCTGYFLYTPCIFRLHKQFWKISDCFGLLKRCNLDCNGCMARKLHIYLQYSCFFVNRKHPTAAAAQQCESRSSKSGKTYLLAQRRLGRRGPGKPATLSFYILSFYIIAVFKVFLYSDRI